MSRLVLVLKPIELSVEQGVPLGNLVDIVTLAVTLQDVSKIGRSR